MTVTFKNLIKMATIVAVSIGVFACNKAEDTSATAEALKVMIQF